MQLSVWRSSFDNWLTQRIWRCVERPMPVFRFPATGLQNCTHYYEADPGVTDAAGAGRSLVIANVQHHRPTEAEGGGTGARRHHFVDCTAFYHICHYLRAWAYSRVESQRRRRDMHPENERPGDVWLNGNTSPARAFFITRSRTALSSRSGWPKVANDFLCASRSGRAGVPVRDGRFVS